MLQLISDGDDDDDDDDHDDDDHDHDDHDHDDHDDHDDVSNEWQPLFCCLFIQQVRFVQCSIQSGKSKIMHILS